MDGSYVDRAACHAAFERMHRRDGIGDRIHLWLACLALFLLPGPTTVVEIAVIPLALFFVVRTVNVAPLWIHGFGQPAMLAALALFGWLAITLFWSRDPAQGITELDRMRWFLLIPLLFPVIERRRVLVRALAFGLIVASIAQLLSVVPVVREVFPFRHPGRVTGWWSPVVGGTIQAGAVGLFVAPALIGVERDRWIGMVGLALSLSGLLASGTRGAWIAGLALLVIAVPALLWKSSPMARKRAGLVLLVACFAGIGAGIAFKEGIAIRVDQAVQEIRSAQAGAFESPTGARIALMQLSIEEGFERPIRGHGAGSVLTLAKERFGEDRGAFHLAHAHSTPAHLLVTGGFPAVLLGAVLFATILRNGWKQAPVDPTRALELGIPFAALGIVLASVFDVVLINMQVAALLAALAALSSAHMPGRDHGLSSSG